ncbi:hypothetical protein ACFVVA_15815 [Kitasatospora sp. NPDC058048]|uniref:hypothetical protein n=1 Tax=Kitasatospora sp. NPDC058048 TaxID=3346313 RepID=UPI0036D97E24
MPNLGVIQCDGLGRPVGTQFVALGKPQTTTTTAYPGADRVDVSPPTGATVTDARGRTTQLWQYRTPTATGNPADADVPRYTYTPGDQPPTRVDGAGNTWSYTYDQRSRQVKVDGPQGACANATPTSGAVAPAKTTVGGSAAYWQDYTYDAVGNRTKLVMHNPTGDVSKDLTIDQVFPAPGTRNTPTTAAGAGGGTGGPHAPTAVKSTLPNNGSTPGSNQYDAAGNATKIANPGANKTLGAVFVLNSGESVRSNSTQLTMQADGNFVVYDPQRVPLSSSQA